MKNEEQIIKAITEDLSPSALGSLCSLALAVLSARYTEAVNNYMPKEYEGVNVELISLKILENSIMRNAGVPASKRMKLFSELGTLTEEEYVLGSIGLATSALDEMLDTIKMFSTSSGFMDHKGANILGAIVLLSEKISMRAMEEVEKDDSH